MRNPCFKCERRSCACHTVCEDYKNFRIFLDSCKESPEAKYFMIERKYKIEKFYGKKPHLSKKRGRK